MSPKWIRRVAFRQDTTYEQNHSEQGRNRLSHGASIGPLSRAVKITEISGTLTGGGCRLDALTGRGLYWRGARKEGVLYRLLNETDQILAAPNAFETAEQAEAYADKLRRRFVAQGFYLTAEGKRIAANDVRLIVISVDT